MNRDLLEQQLPKAVFTISRQSMIVLAMAIISVAFITIFHPFSIYESLDFIITKNTSRIINSVEDTFYIALASVVLLGSIIVLISRIILVKTASTKLTYRGFLLWCWVEFVIVAFSIAILSAALFHQESISIFRLFTKVLGRTTCILFIPYVFCWLYIIIVDKASQLKALRESIDKNELTQQKSYILFYDATLCQARGSCNDRVRR